MRRAVIQALLMLVTLVSSSTYAADRYWVGASGAAWNTTDSWSTSSGGSNGASVPGTSDTAIFDSGDTDNCTLTAAVSVTAINMKSGYTGTVDAAGNNITTSSTVDVTGGTLEIDSSSILAVTGVLTVDGGTLTATDGTIDADNTVILSDDGILTAPSGNFTIGKHWSSWIGTPTFNHSSGTLTFEDTVQQNITGTDAGQNFNNVTISNTHWRISLHKPSITLDGTLTIDEGAIFDAFQSNKNVTVGCDWKNSGTFLHKSGTVTFDATTGTIDIISGGSAFYDLTLNDGGGDAVFELEDALDVDNDLTITGGTLDTKSGENNSINIGGDWSNSDTFTSQSGTVTFDGTSTITTGGIGDGQDFYNVVLNGTSATQATNAIDIDNNFTITSGTWDTASFDMTVGGTSDTSGGTLITSSSPTDSTDDSTDLTAPTLSSSSPSDGATGVDINANIILTFSEDVVVKTGNIIIRKSSDNSTVEIIDVTSAKVSGSSATTITVNPSSSLDELTNYYINIDATAFDDRDSSSYAGISDSKTLNFTTISLMPDPLTDKDVVGSIEAQAGIAKRFIQHSTIPVLNRMEWLQRDRKGGNLSHQGITLTFADPMIDKVSRFFPLSTYTNPTAELLPNDWAIWTKGSATIGKVGATGTASIKDIDSKGVTVGVDKKIDEHRMLGAALRFGNDDTGIGSSGTTLATDAYSLSMYGTLSNDDTTFVDVVVGIGILGTDHLRKHETGSLTGSRNGKQLFGSIVYSGESTKDQLTISPYGRIDIGYTILSSYSESGTNAALTYDKQKLKTGMVSIGVLLNNTIKFGGITLKPNGRLEYGADISSSSDAMVSYISDTSTDYTLEVSKEASHNFRAGLGIDVETNGGWRFNAAYERYQAVNSGYTDTISLGAFYLLNANTQYTLALDGGDSSNARIKLGLDVGLKNDWFLHAGHELEQIADSEYANTIRLNATLTF